MRLIFFDASIFYGPPQIIKFILNTFKANFTVM